MYKFNVYIGPNLICNEAPNIKAVVEPEFYIPHGKYNLDGTEYKKDMDCFINLYDLGTYFADWVDFAGNDQLISAKIHLNVISLNKKFVGNEIIKLIDKLDKFKNYTSIRSFTEIMWFGVLSWKKLLFVYLRHCL